MKKPGTDISDPKTYSRAKGVATRKNNDFKKKVLKTVPLFADAILAEYKPVTPEVVIEKRIAFQEENAVWWKNHKREEQTSIRRFREECRGLCRNDAEFRRLIEKSLKSFGGRHKFNRWYGLLCRLRNRLKPLSETADLVQAWMEQENEPVTHWHLWRTRGDGIERDEILSALHELRDRELVVFGMVVPVTTEDGRAITCISFKLAPNEPADENK